MKRILVSILFLLSIMPISLLSAQSKESGAVGTKELLSGKQVQREMKGDEIHKYHVHLESNQFLYVRVEQHGIDVVVKIFDPKDKKVSEIDTPIGDTGSEIIQFFNKLSGDYVIEIHPFDSSSKSGNYNLKATITDSRWDFQNQLILDYDKEFIEMLEWATQEMGKDILTYNQLSQGHIPKKATINATHYEWGYFLGLLSKKQHGSLKKTRTPGNEEINQQIIEMYQSIYPQYLDLIKGVCQSSGLSIEDVDLRFMEHQFFMGVWWFLFKYPEFIDLMNFSHNENISKEACSLIAYHQKESEKTIVGRNFDWRADIPRFIVHSNIEGIYKTMGYTGWAINHWIMDGLNEKGLFIGSSTNADPVRFDRTGYKPYPDKPSIEAHHLKRIILNLCSNVNEAVALIKKINIWFPADVSHYLLMDKSGNTVVVEYDLKYQPIFYYKNGPYLAITNTAYQSGPYYMQNICWRYNEAINRLKTKINKPDDILTTMASIRPTAGSARTLWTSMYDVSNGKMDVYFRSEDFSIPHTFSLAYSDNQENTVISKLEHDLDEKTSIESPGKTRIDKINSSKLFTYVGKYKFSDFWFANISQEGDHLFIQNTGVGKCKIYSQTDTEFSFPENNFKIIFIKDNKGKVTHFDFIMHGIKYTARKISNQPDDDYKSISKISLIICGILFLLFIVFNIGKFVVCHFKSSETRRKIKTNRTLFSRFSKTWICVTSTILLGNVVVLLFLNDLNFLEKLLNFGLYKPGADEIALSWAVLILVIFSVVFIIASWIRRDWILFERILISIVTSVMIYFIIDMWSLGLITL